MAGLHPEDLDSAPCGFLAFSDAGIIQLVNQTLLDLLGYREKEELLGKSVETLFTIAGRIFYQTHFFPLIKLHGKASEIFFSLKTLGSDTLPVICNAVRKNVNGSISNHCILFPVHERGKYEQELLEARRQAEEALEKNQDLVAAKEELQLHSIELDKQVGRLQQINNDISQFSKVISHDLQESIRKIAVWADKVAIESREVLSESHANQLRRINTECIKIRELAANIERYISLNIRTEELVTVDVNKLIHQAYNKITANHPHQHVDISVDSIPEIQAYPRQLELLFHNIFDNSLQYSDASSPLKISINNTIIQQNSFRTIQGKYRYIDFVKLTVSDNAQGLEINNPESIFHILPKIDRPNPASGFGLAFCKKIVDNHNGSINLISAKNKGTTITLLLPIEQS
jgi:sigma-B regulation protein RsbU (phosphoserine phosphatase)